MTPSPFARFCLLVGLAAGTVVGCTDFGSGLLTDDGGNGNGTGNGDTTTVSFATHIFPIFQTHCGGALCHSPCGNNNGGRLCLATYDTLMGDNVVDTINVEESRILRALEGNGLTRMPYGRNPLPDSLIRLIRTWIEEGAHDN